MVTQRNSTKAPSRPAFLGTYDQTREKTLSSSGFSGNFVRLICPFIWNSVAQLRYAAPTSAPNLRSFEYLIGFRILDLFIVHHVFLDLAHTATARAHIQRISNHTKKNPTHIQCGRGSRRPAQRCEKMNKHPPDEDGSLVMTDLVERNAPSESFFSRN